MRIFPSRRDEWFALLFFPFKAYIVVVIPFYYIFRIFCPQPFLGTMVSDGTFDTFASIFLFCLFALFVGATVQLVVSGWEHAVASMLFVVIPVAVFFVFRFL